MTRAAGVDRRIAHALRLAGRLEQAIADAAAAQDVEGTQIVRLSDARRLVVRTIDMLDGSTLARVRAADAEFEARRTKAAHETVNAIVVRLGE